MTDLSGFTPFGYPEDLTDEEIADREAAEQIASLRPLWAAEVKAGIHVPPISPSNPPKSDEEVQG